MKPMFFTKPADFRKWLQKNHAKEKELIVGFYKVDSGKPSMSWPESVDEALCFGWIDGIRKSIDEQSYQIRFTPRKASSIWSAVNIKKVEELKKLGLMQAPGIAAFEKLKEEKSKIYSHEKEEAKLPPHMEKEFKSNKKAWKYFLSLAPSYQKISIHWIVGAKQEATKIKRLHIIINDSENHTNQWKNNKYIKK